MTRYRPVDPRIDFPALERDILSFWRDAGIFARSLAQREGSSEWVFYDGPPTANNKPHIGHVEARTFKDLYPRYRTMTGHYVHRKAGWDCHGLPVEVEVEKEIGTRTKRDIEAFGIDRFVTKCRESVTRYVEDWKALTERLGFWIDMEDDYWTMDADYVQSVWWALKRLHERGLLVQDDKVTWYCPRCGTGLSDHEVALGYTQVKDPSVYVKFPVTDGPPEVSGAALVGWTTTPWTLPANLGLAVAAEEPYVRVRVGDEDLVVAESLRSVLDDGETVSTFPGRVMVGARYRAPFDNIEDGNTHRVVAADFVSMSDGTGVVHIAPGFGQDDLETGKREGWPTYRPLDDDGRFVAPGPELVRGLWIKDADPLLTEDLRVRGLLLKAEEYEHTYPLCWRCSTVLLMFARPAWYVRTTARKQELLDANEATSWYPDHIKHGRYGDWLENNVDWSLSRERYWGTPLPIWICPSGHQRAVGSLVELSDLAGRDVTGLDPHRPVVDQIGFTCPECGEESRRVTDVIDAWFDSGAMPFAQWGYMGEDSPAAEVFRRRYPADFIAEGLDQTRGWFYTLMAEGVLLFDRSAYRNVICHGLVVDAEGRKMSKRLGNVIDPMEALDRLGADAVRWFIVAGGSPWSNRRASFDIIEDVVRRFFLTLWNTYAFFVTYANLDEPDLSAAPAPPERPPLDRWALSRLHRTVDVVRRALDAFDATGAAREIEALVDDLSNWYVRRSRRRFWDPVRATGPGAAAEKLAAYATLAECLTTVAVLVAPIAPFVSEEMYRNLLAESDPSRPESVHLVDYPVGDQSQVDAGLEEAMATVRAAVSLGRTVRTNAKVKVRQPLSRAVLHVSGEPARLGPLLPLMAEELNVKEVAFAESAEELTGWRAKPNFRVLGPRLGPRVQEVAAALASDDGSLAAALARGDDVTVPASGDGLTVTPGDVELSQQTEAGWGLASDGSVTVALDLEPSEGLRHEGMARELVHHVQGLRKSAGLHVSDRIVLGLETDRVTWLALAPHLDSMASEVLATSVADGAVDGSLATATVDLGGSTATLSLRPA
jgi:isoleucyl-tRNA synthetase